LRSEIQATDSTCNGWSANRAARKALLASAPVIRSPAVIVLVNAESVLLVDVVLLRIVVLARGLSGLRLL
jgi:hypothetical protein